ncbi:ADP-ribosylglycohydrolase family protein, partial [Bacteroidota bacterium]
MPQAVIDLGEKFGRIMNYGDGVYGGQFVGAMYAEAFFETDIHKIIEAGLACIPAESQYTEAIRDVITWHKENPDNWQHTWQLIENKYNLNHDYRRFSCNGTDPNFNIDAKLNGAYIVMGLLYGEGDMDKTIVISMRCGADSDCNPSNAAGVLATSLGMDNLPEKYKTGIDDTTNFSYTAYNFPSLLAVCEKLTKEALVIYGGSIEENDEGIEEFMIPVQVPVVGALEQCWEPTEVEGDVKFTAEEMAQIHYRERPADEYVTIWQVAAGFAKDGVDPLDLLDMKFGPESDKSFNEWKEMPAPEGTKEMDLYKYSASDNCVAYLRTSVWIEEAQDVIFEMGSDDGIKVWLNGAVIHENNANRGHMQGDDKVEVSLNSGWNEVMMKISQGIGGWAASLVITDLEHHALKGLKFE